MRRRQNSAPRPNRSNDLSPAARRPRFTVRSLIESLEGRVLLATNPIVTENQLPGTPQSTWGVSGNGDAALQGFPTDISVNVGATQSFKITDTANALYHIDIYRMGYYQGNGARLVATIPSSQTIRKSQPAPLKDTTTGLVDCGNWSVTASWAVPSTAVSGIYFARLVREDTGGASRIVFVVRNDASHSDLLLQTADTTWQAYNTYGGNSLYQGNAGIFTGQTDPGRAAKVSYNRPLAIDGGSDGYTDYNSPFHGEYPMVRFLERNGYDVTYFTDVDSDRNGALIKNHKAFLSVGHDEYWSGGQRNNVEAARDAGVNLAFFSGNESFWKTRWETSIDGSGTPYRTLVCYKESKTGVKQDPSGIWTGTWRDARLSPPYDGGRPENAMSGVLYMNDRTNVDLGIPLKVPSTFSNLRFWRNTPVANLSAGQTATLSNYIVGYETDEDLDNGFRPAGLIDMSATPFTTPEHVISPWGTDVGPGSSTHTITLYRDDSGALVFGAGTVQWSWGLDGNHNDIATTPDASMQQATVNLFADMNVQPATLMSGLVAAAASTDLTKPTSTITSPPPNSTFNEGSTVTISGTASDSGGGVVGGVEVSTDGGLTWHPATGRNAWTYTWAPGASGAINIRSRATDDSGNIEIPGAGITVTVTQPKPVMALGFEEGTGTTTADSSGNGNIGTLSNATWSTAGKYGKALSFNGTNTWVTVADSNSLDLTTRMTLEAWVKPTSLSGWTAVAVKERGTNGLAYALYNSDNTNQPPAVYVNTGGTDQEAAGTTALPLNAWSYLAATYDGAGTLRLYVNGNLVKTQSIVGTSISTSTNPLRIGGDAPWGEYFSGLIDEVRVYNVALAQSDIQSDMNTAVVPTGPVDTTAPAVSVTSPANNATLAGTVTVSASASDNVGVAGVQFLLNGNPLGPEDTASPYSVSWDTTTVANGTYVLTARARDAAGNVTTSAAVNVTVNQPDTTPPTLSSRTPAAGAANVPLNTAPTATFSETVQSGTIQFTLKDSANNAVAATLSYNATTRTATLTPSSPLAAGTTYTATVSGAADTAGNAMTTTSWSFTTATPDTTAPTVTAKAPAAGATNVATNATVTATFSESIQPGTLSFVLRDAANNAVAATVTYDDTTHTATLAPSVTLANSTTYTATLSGAKDLAGNTMAGTVQWSFTTAAAPAIGAGPFSLWTDSTVPAVAADPDTGSVELGMKFRTDVAGVVTGVRYYKSSTNTGTHTGSLWSSTGALLATVTFPNETASGWQQATFSTPVAVNANTTYVISYHAPAGHYATNSGYFTTTGTDNGPLHALASGVDGLNGVYNYGTTSAFPASSYQDTNYWVDVVFARNAAVQTTTAQFNTGTSSGVTVSASGDGALQLAGGFRDDFNALNAADWTTTSWTSAGGGTTAVSVASGILNIRGAEILSTQTVPSLTPVEGRVTIGAATNRNFGLATDLATAAGNYWAVFTTAATTNSLYARVNNGGTLTDVRISALPSGYHVYRVTPTATGFQFYVDGALKTTINQTFPTGTPLRMVMSAFTGSPDPIMKVDYVQLLANASGGTFTSAVLDAGRTASWGSVNWNASLPAGTTMTIQVRGGNSATPDGTWSGWSAVTDGGAIGLPASRYLQYQVVFNTTDTTVTPTLYDISFTWA